MKSLKITALIAVAFAAAGCQSGAGTTANVTSANDIASLRSDIAEVKQLSLQALEAANQARQEAHNNSMKINNNFKKSLYK